MARPSVPIGTRHVGPTGRIQVKTEHGWHWVPADDHDRHVLMYEWWGRTYGRHAFDEPAPVKPVDPPRGIVSFRVTEAEAAELAAEAQADGYRSVAAYARHLVVAPRHGYFTGLSQEV